MAAAEFGAAAGAVDDAACATLRVNRTDLRVLAAVASKGPMSASALAGAVGLSPAATTTAVQRLSAAGYVVRKVDSQDRRRASVTVTEGAVAAIQSIYAPVAAAGHEVLARYSDVELVVVERFLREGVALQHAQAERIRSLRR